MLRIDNLKLPVGADEKALRAACERARLVISAEISSVQLLRRAFDSREGVKLVCSCAVEVKNETAALKRCKNKNVQSYAPRRYAPPAPIGAPAVSPVVVGAGPAGLFCALLLARCAQSFERLPCVEDADLLRNILYSGVWLKYNCKNEKQKHKTA